VARASKGKPVLRCTECGREITSPNGHEGRAATELVPTSESAPVRND
jgi:ribosomal protein S27E